MPGKKKSDRRREKIEHPSGINPDEFRVPASDAKGHTSRLWLRCQPGHANQIARVKDSKRFPYRSTGDILRHALARHLKWLESLPAGKGIPSVTGAVDAILDLVRDEEFAADFRLVFDKLGSRISAHMGAGSLGEARRLLLQVLRHIDGMPDCYWRGPVPGRSERQIQARTGDGAKGEPEDGGRRRLKVGWHSYSWQKVPRNNNKEGIMDRDDVVFLCGVALLVALTVLAAAVIAIPLARFDYNKDAAEFVVTKATIEQARGNPELINAALVHKIVEANQWLANRKYVNGVPLIEWYVPDSVESLEPLRYR